MHENDAAEHPEELLLGNLHRFLELRVLILGAGSVPFGVLSGDTRAQTSGDVILHLSSFTHTIIQCIYFQDKLLVHLLVYFLESGFIECHAPVVKYRVSNDFFAKVSED